MSVWVAGLIAVAAITATYFSCIRPHLRGRGCAMPSDPELDRVGAADSMTQMMHHMMDN